MQDSKTQISSTTQKFLDIYDIVDDFLILKDGATALIITLNAMNFGLLAEEEQDAIIYSYAGLLNSLNYPIQIVIRSQTKDVSGYIQLLDEELGKADSDLKREWIKKYRQFVADLIRERNVLDKKFYVVIPATSLEMGLLPPSTVLPGVKQPDLTTVEKSVILEKAREILEPKRDHLMAQFGRIGLIARQLNTQEIIQLFYLNYNPEASEGQQITDTSSYTTPLVQASVVKGIMQDNMQNPNPAPNTNQGNVPPTSAPVTNSASNMGAPTAPQMPTPVAPVSPSMPNPTPNDAQNEINSAASQVGNTPPVSNQSMPSSTANMRTNPMPAAPSPTATNSAADSQELPEI